MFFIHKQIIKTNVFYTQKYTTDTRIKTESKSLSNTLPTDEDSLRVNNNSNDINKSQYVVIDKTAFESMMNKLSSLETKIDQMNNKNKITSYTKPIHSNKCDQVQINNKIKRYKIPKAKNGMTMEIFAKKDGKYLLNIKFNVNNNLFHGKCILCKRWENEIKKINKHVKMSIWSMTQSELNSPEYYADNRDSLVRHYNEYEFHQLAEQFEVEFEELISNVLATHADIAYGQQLYASTAEEFVEKIVLAHNQKLRNKCKNKKCCPVGQMYHGMWNDKKWTDLYYEFCLDMIKSIVSNNISILNVVIISGTLDGLSIASLKNELMGIFSKGENKMRMFIIELSEFEYDDAENKVKNVEYSIKVFAEALKRLGLFPTDIQDENIFYTLEMVVIMRNFCMDGAYLWSLWKNAKGLDAGPFPLKFPSKYAIDAYIQKHMPVTEYYEEPGHDPLHGNELDAKKAKLIVFTFTICNKLLKKGMYCIKVSL